MRCVATLEISEIAKKIKFVIFGIDIEEILNKTRTVKSIIKLPKLRFDNWANEVLK